MKSTVERLSPTRVRINVEVPFLELKPDFDKAYKKLAKNVRLPGFRPGKAPARLIEARIGRGAVLEQVINDALPDRYSAAVASTNVQPLGQPNVEITKIEDGEELVFTAEVDVRPDLTLPDLDALKISVDPVKIEDADIDAELDALRARFGTMTPVERAAQTGDIVTIDLSGTVDGENLPEASSEGLTHEVGKGRLLEGIDEAIVGLSAGESRVFTTTLAAGAHAGREAQVTVTVKTVKERELPAPDDDFAQLASEFDTIEELRANLADQIRHRKRVEQAEQIRNLALETMLEQVEVPVPDAIVQAQIEQRLQQALQSFGGDERRFAEALAKQNSSREEFDAESRDNAEKAAKTMLLVDAVADALKVEVTQQDLQERLALQSRQYGMEPQQLLKFYQETNQLPLMFADVRRGKALAAVVQGATVTDTDGNVVDTDEFFGSRDASAAARARGGEPAPAKKKAESREVGWEAGEDVEDLGEDEAEAEEDLEDGEDLEDVADDDDEAEAKAEDKQNVEDKADDETEDQAEEKADDKKDAEDTAEDKKADDA